jgi:hypothetical protein
LGLIRIPNGAGVHLAQGAFTSTIRSNLISGNNGSGILVQPLFRQVPHDNFILKNKIGTSVNGLFSLPNNRNGIEILNGRTTMVGSPVLGDGNLISGNPQWGCHHR